MSISSRFKVYDFSENIFVIEIKNKNEYPDQVQAHLSLSEHLRSGYYWVDVAAGEKSIFVTYNSLEISTLKALEIIHNQLEEFVYKEESDQNLELVIPVYYSEESGLDIQDVAATHNLSIQEIAHLHSQPTYKVKMIGFTPGFAYIGDLPKELFMSRLSKPRVNLLAGSVGITGNRTCIYPLGGPGGWRIIGRTPLTLFHKDKKNPFGILPGINIRFKPMTKQEYENFKQDNPL